MFARIVFLLLTACQLASSQTALPVEAAEFLKWYRGYQGSFYPEEVLKAYRARLVEKRVAAAEVERQVAIVTEVARSSPPEMLAIHFDKIYSAPAAPFKQEPSAFLVRMVEGLKPGTALDVAMGQGRNALYLASKGWTVTGYDISEGGIALAEGQARKSGLNLKTVTASHELFDYGVAKWDLVVETFAFTKLTDAAYRKRVTDSLKPGGMLLIEGFGGGPKNEMLEMFKDLRVIFYQDCEDVADWSMQKSKMARIAAKKE